MKFGVKEGFLVVAVLALLCGCWMVLRPFLSSLLWAVVLVCSSWPLYSRLLKLVGHRHSLAAFLMTLGMILILLLPFVIVGTTLADNVNELTAETRKFIAQGPPALTCRTKLPPGDRICRRPGDQQLRDCRPRPVLAGR